MVPGRKSLSANATLVLQLIARGYTYEQILVLEPMLTYLDIFDAAREALELQMETSNDYADRVLAIRKDHPRAYEQWSDEEDTQLTHLVRAGKSVDEIAAIHQRQPSAIRNRMTRLGL